MQSNGKEELVIAFRLSATCLCLLLASGCGGGFDGSTTQVLTAEAARQALLDMDRLQVPGAVHARFPKEEDAIKFINNDRIDVGAWHCDLKQKTFYAAFHHPGVMFHESTEVEGVFQGAPNGKWVAKVTSAHD